MNENEKPNDSGQTPPSGSADQDRKYWIDDDGNVHGIVLTVQLDHCVEFVDKAIDLTPAAKEPDKPTA